MQEIIGWLSSAILIATVGGQVFKQWRTGTSQGVPISMFLGQITASMGFLTYSILVLNWVNLATNAVMLTIALIGGALTWRLKSDGSQSPAALRVFTCNCSRCAGRDQRMTWLLAKMRHRQISPAEKNPLRLH